jgi:hypothetical protein
MKEGDEVIYYRYIHGVIAGVHSPQKYKAKVLSITKTRRVRIELDDGSVRTVLPENLERVKNGT